MIGIIVTVGFAILGAAVAWWFSFWWEPKNTQSTWCWCPRCKEDLCSGGTFLSDDERGVRYHCNMCHHESTWYFDSIAPFVIEGKYECPTPVIHGDIDV